MSLINQGMNITDIKKTIEAFNSEIKKRIVQKSLALEIDDNTISQITSSIANIKQA